MATTAPRPSAQPTTQPSKPPTQTRKAGLQQHIDPQALPYLEGLLDEQPVLNDRSDELNTLYQTQIYHTSTRFKGPKVSEGYEELVAAQHPLQVIYPDKYHTTGLAYSATTKSMNETHNPTVQLNSTHIFCCIRVGNQEHMPMVMYSSINPTLNRLTRWKVATWGTYLLMLLTIALAVLTYILSPFHFKYEKDVLFVDQTRTLGYDVCNLVVCFLAMLILAAGIITKNPKIFLVFIIIFAVDCFINLFRLFTIIQFLYMLCQLFLIFLTNYYRVLLSPTWYFSQ